MGKMQRNKGATFERTIANRLSEKFGVKVQRNIGQARDGGNDIDFPPFTIECKRYASLGLIERALSQAEAAVAPDRPTPLVVAKGDNTPPIVAMRFEAFLELAATIRSYGDALRDIGGVHGEVRGPVDTKFDEPQCARLARRALGFPPELI